MNGAANGARTRDPGLGKPMLCQLSYCRKNIMNSKNCALLSATQWIRNSMAKVRFFWASCKLISKKSRYFIWNLMFFICWDDYNQDRTPQKGGCVHAGTMFAAVPPGMNICVHLCGDSVWRTESVQFSADACCNPHSEGCRGRITLQEGRRKPPSPFLLRNIAKVEH